MSVCLFNSSQTVTLVLGVNTAGMRAAQAEHVKISCFTFMGLRRLEDRTVFRCFGKRGSTA